MPKILIVEDSPDLIALYQLIFTQHKFEPMIVTTREKLTRQLVLNRPDIILLDIHLNGEDGRKYCKEIKQNKDFKTLPIILTSIDSEKLLDYRDYLADDYLKKPFDPAALIEKINLLLIKNDFIKK